MFCVAPASPATPVGEGRCGVAVLVAPWAGEIRCHTETRGLALPPLNTPGHSKERCPRDRQWKQQVLRRQRAAVWDGEKQLKHLPTRSAGLDGAEDGSRVDADAEYHETQPSATPLNRTHRDSREGCAPPPRNVPPVERNPRSLGRLRWGCSSHHRPRQWSIHAR